jgi:GNAT superfamily N-acetyltransferase
MAIVGFTVRRVRTSDASLLRAVRLAALRDAPFAFASTFEAEAARGDDEWEVRARWGATGEERATFLAYDDHRAIGLVGAYRADPDARDVELVSMWTDPLARRHGVARALGQAAVEWAAATGARTMKLWVTRGNEPARLLYESLGFAETGEYQPLPSDPCKDEVRMVLTV